MSNKPSHDQHNAARSTREQAAPAAQAMPAAEKFRSDIDEMRKFLGPSSRGSPALEAPAELRSPAPHLIAAAAQMRDAMDGAGVKIPKLLAAIRSVSAAERPILIRVYEDMYPEDFLKRFNRELPEYRKEDPNLTRREVLALLHGQDDRANALAVVRLIKKMDWDGVVTFLAQRTNEEIAQLREAMPRLSEAGGGRGGVTLEKVLDRIPGKFYRDQAHAYAEGRELDAEAIVLNKSLNKTFLGIGRKGRIAAAQNILAEHADADDREYLGEQVSKARGGRKSFEEIYRKRVKGLDAEVIDALYHGDFDEARMLLLGKAFSRDAPPVGVLVRLLNDTDPAFRDDLESRYRNRFGIRFSDELRRLKPDERELVECLARQGRLSEEQKVYFALKGPLKDPELVVDLLQYKSAAETADFRSRYEKADSLGLDRRILTAGYDGRTLTRLALAAQGRGETPEELVAQLDARAEQERSGVSGFVIRTCMPKTNALLEYNLARVKEAIAQARSDGVVSNDEAARIATVGGRYQRTEADQYGERKSKVSQKLGTLAVSAVELGVVASTEGLALPAVLAVGVVSGSAAHTLGDYLGEGRSFEKRRIGSDVVRGAIEGAAFTGAGRLGLEAADSMASNSAVVGRAGSTAIKAAVSSTTAGMQIPKF